MYRNASNVLPLLFVAAIVWVASAYSYAEPAATETVAVSAQTASDTTETEGPKDSLAVLPFTHRGAISTADAGEIIADLMLREVSASEYNLVDGAQVKTQIAEYNKKPHDLVQNTGQAIEFGKQTDIRYLVVGELSRLGSRYYLTARVIDSQTGTVKSKGNIEFLTFDEIVNALNRLTQQLELPQYESPTPSDTQAEVEVTRTSFPDAIEALYLDKKLTQQQAKQALALLQTDANSLDQYDAMRWDYYQRVVDGALPPGKLQRALDLVEVTERLDAQKAQQKIGLERRALIETLLAKAKTYGYREDGLSALATLDELLELDPAHEEAKLLRTDVTWQNPPNQIGETWTNNLGMTFTYIPAGRFMMGSPADDASRSDDEAQHPVILTNPYLLGITEVTQEQWQKVMGENPSHFKGKSLPVEKINWDDALAFCQKLAKIDGRRYRLPTEAEWEHACRAGTETAYYFGDNPDDLRSVAWYRDNSRKTSRPVQQKPANPWGLYDIHGNVFEWCHDWYTPQPPQTLTKNPKGPSTGTKRILRGGAWYAKQEACRAAYRGWNTPDSRLYTYGLRVLVELDQQR